MQLSWIFPPPPSHESCGHARVQVIPIATPDLLTRRCFSATRREETHLWVLLIVSAGLVPCRLLFAFRRDYARLLIRRRWPTLVLTS